jgi:hypothetical protein
VISETDPRADGRWLRFWFEPWCGAHPSWIASEPLSALEDPNTTTLLRRAAYVAWCMRWSLALHWGGACDWRWASVVAAPADRLHHAARLVGLVALLSQEHGLVPHLTRAAATPDEAVDDLRWARQRALAHRFNLPSLPPCHADAVHDRVGMLLLRQTTFNLLPCAWTRLRMRFACSCTEEAHAPIADKDESKTPEAETRQALRLWNTALRRAESHADDNAVGADAVLALEGD